MKKVFMVLTVIITAVSLCSCAGNTGSSVKSSASASSEQQSDISENEVQNNLQASSTQEEQALSSSDTEGTSSNGISAVTKPASDIDDTDNSVSQINEPVIQIQSTPGAYTANGGEESTPTAYTPGGNEGSMAAMIFWKYNDFLNWLNEDKSVDPYYASELKRAKEKNAINSIDSYFLPACFDKATLYAIDIGYAGRYLYHFETTDPVNTDKTIGVSIDCCLGKVSSDEYYEEQLNCFSNNELFTTSSLVKNGIEYLISDPVKTDEFIYIMWKQYDMTFCATIAFENAEFSEPLIELCNVTKCPLK